MKKLCVLFGLLCLMSFSCKMNVTEYKNQVDELTKQLEEERSKNDELTKQNESLSNQILLKETELKDSNYNLNSIIEKLKSSLTKEQELRNLTIAELDKAKIDTSELNKINNDLSQQISELNTKNTDNQDEINSLLNQINSLTNDYNTLIAEKSVNNENLEKLRNDYNVLNDLNTELTSKYNDLVSQNKSLQIELDTLKKDQQSINNAFLDRKLNNMYYTSIALETQTNFYEVYPKNSSAYDRLANLFADMYTKKQISEERLDYEMDILYKIFKDDSSNRYNRTPSLLREHISDYKNNIQHPKGLSLNEVVKNLKYLYDGVDFTDKNITLDEYGFQKRLTDKIITNGSYVRSSGYLRRPYINSIPIDDENTYLFHDKHTKYRIVEEITKYDQYFDSVKLNVLSSFSASKELSYDDRIKTISNMKVYLIYFYENNGFHSNTIIPPSIKFTYGSGHGYMSTVVFLDRNSNVLCCYFPQFNKRGVLGWSTLTKEEYFEIIDRGYNLPFDTFVLDLKENI